MVGGLGRQKMGVSSYAHILICSLLLLCEHCETKLARAIDLETHMVNHGLLQKHSCELCGKKFHLKWRLRKHVKIHCQEAKAKYCHYFNNQKECPFNPVGCMYKHEKSGLCSKQSCSNKLCEFEHIEMKTNEMIETLDNTEEDNQTDDEPVRCILCECTFLDYEELSFHMKSSHMDSWRKPILC